MHVTKSASNARERGRTPAGMEPGIRFSAAAAMLRWSAFVATLSVEEDAVLPEACRLSDRVSRCDHH